MKLRRFFHLLLGPVVLVCLALAPMSVSAGAPGLPPRPPLANGSGDDGGGDSQSGIALHINIAPDAALDNGAWTALWTVVQWQDGLGNWNDVDGWQGPPSGAPADSVHKFWDFSETLFGKGPFRWVVKQGQSGSIVAASSSFYLPQNPAQTLKVEVQVPAGGARAVSGPMAAAVVLNVRHGATADLWTVMQWGDGFGNWYDIVRWEGPLDAINSGGGIRTISIEPVLLGRGIFRWLVFQGRTGPLLTSSNVFYLPGSSTEIVQVEAAGN